MLVSNTLKYVFVRVPRAASHSISSWCKTTGDAIKISNYHSHEVPEEYSKYFIWCSVRNPYQRCISWWWYENKRKSVMVTFPNFMRFLMREKKKGGIYVTQKQFVELAGIKAFVRIENLEEEVKRLPFYNMLFNKFSTIPKFSTNANASYKPRGRGRLLNPEHSKLVLDYCREDFSYFGYKV